MNDRKRLGAYLRVVHWFENEPAVLGRTRAGDHSPRKLQEQYMLKKLTLAAALAATLIAGSAAVANAEISGGGAPPGPTTERGLQLDYAARHGGDRANASELPTTGGYAYGYAPQTRVYRSHQRGVYRSHRRSWNY
jgi:hypothetical protein